MQLVLRAGTTTPKQLQEPATEAPPLQTAGSQPRARRDSPEDQPGARAAAGLGGGVERVPCPDLGHRRTGKAAQAKPRTDKAPDRQSPGPGPAKPRTDKAPSRQSPGPVTRPESRGSDLERRSACAGINAGEVDADQQGSVGGAGNNR
ncbi:hypothetical protein Q0Z83_077950 [Actinoplanes sichuanensis]|nr:hypothetical protein Q0Z83_077950 [Actinoplanes sichuanensis]